MRKLIVAVFVIVWSMSGPLLACGDKFFQIGRGERFSRAYRALHPGQLVIYTGGRSLKGKGLADSRLQKHFKKAGHRVTLIESPSALSAALQATAVDVIVTDDSGVAMLGTLPASATAQPAVLVLKESDKIGRALSRIEDMMSERVKTVSRQRS